jgi:30S ribosomal protein S31
MGKGDKKTKRGKIFAKSYGKYRPKPKSARKAQRENQANENKENKKEDKE